MNDGTDASHLPNKAKGRVLWEVAKEVREIYIYIKREREMKKKIEQIKKKVHSTF